MTPYEVFYGHQPPSFISYLPCTSKVQAMDSLLQSCDFTLAALKYNLAMAQNCMKKQVDQQCSERVFEVSD